MGKKKYKQPQAVKNKKSSQKKSQSAPQKIKKANIKKKLNPGSKQCRKCKSIMPIHRKVCTQCGNVHHMRKKKQDIMKSLNKITPILIKSIIQNDDFNQFKGWNQDILFEVGKCSLLQQQKGQYKIPQISRSKSESKSMTRRKSHQPSQSSQAHLTFKPTNNPSFEYIQVKKPITCVGSSKNILAFVQSINKIHIDQMQKQRLTISAYGLENFNLVGAQYRGQSILHYCQTSQDNIITSKLKFESIFIKKYISKIKIFNNLVALLTGQSTLIIISIPSIKSNDNPQLTSKKSTSQSPSEYQLADSLQIIQPYPDKITAFQFLRSTVSQNEQNSQKSIKIVVGTLFGRISVYEVTKQGYNIIRYISNAHNQMITQLTQCSLNSVDAEQSNVLFGSGCYDGTIAIWDLYESSPVFTYQCSNRKIWSIHWDPGSKFLFINRDQQADNCIIICFYSINKIQTTIHLSSEIQTRTIKTSPIRNHSLTSFDYSSKCIPVLDPINGFFKILRLEELRSNSLKKKKPKKDDLIQKYHRVCLAENGPKVKGSQESVHIQQIIDKDDQQSVPDKNKNKQKQKPIQQKKFPIFSDISVQYKQQGQFIYMSAYNGILVLFKNLPKKQ